MATTLPDMSSGKPASGEESGPKSSDSSESSSDSSSGEREAAGEQLKKAGEQVAQAAEQIGKAGNEAPDPLMPEMEPADSASDELVFADSQPASASPDSASSSSDMAGDRSPAGDTELSEAVREAQQAMIEAGIQLQQAGDAVARAESTDDMARAQEMLARARIMVIVAGQDLLTARSSDPQTSDVYDQAEATLNDANVAIVIATDAVEGLPDFDVLEAAGLPAATGELEQELEDSLGDFDTKILMARRTVLQPGANEEESDLPAAGDVLPDEVVIGSGSPDGSGREDERDDEKTTNGVDSVGAATDQGDESQVAIVPEDIGPGNDDDIVAQQLREAAMAEDDLDLREKLWEEYRRYKSGL